MGCRLSLRGGLSQSLSLHLLPFRRKVGHTMQSMFIQLPAARRHYVAATLTAVAILGVTVLALPNARALCVVVPAFMPIFGTSIVLSEALTAFLLWMQFRVSGLVFFAALTGAYVFGAVTATMHLIVYPGVFATDGLSGSGRQTAIWLWLLWRGGYALSVMIAIKVAKAYGPRVTAAATHSRLAMISIIAPVLVSVLLSSAAIRFHALLPDLVSGNLPDRHLSANPITIGIAVLCGAALAYQIVTTRLRTAVDLFTAVALLAGLMDVALTIAAGPRYSVGWYAARLASMCSAGALLGALLNETGRAYQSLAFAHSALRDFSIRDALTGVFNRAHFDERFRQELSIASETGSPVSLLLIDVDHFKAYNDEYGHLAGDACLQSVARTLQATLGCPGGFVARYGGEEFAAVLPDCEPDIAVQIADRLRKSVLQTTAGLRKNVPGRSHVTVSVGHASSSLHRRLDASALLAAADLALYRAKKLGRNRVEDMLQGEHVDPAAP